MTVFRSTVRWNRDLEEFELRCEDCRAKGNVASYWPITREFWDIHTMLRCRSCNAERDRLRLRERRLDPARRAKDVASVAAWRLRNPEYNREYAATQRRLLSVDTRRERLRAYYLAHRDEILERQREYKRRRRRERAA